MLNVPNRLHQGCTLQARQAHQTSRADRNNDAAGAAAALRQIETADEGVRSAGQERWSAYFSEQLAKAKVIRDRLKGR
jgi:hypothetical protein